MMCNINAGMVNCVIVKDLSRFRRDYIESGRYIQKTFPALGVRFIALGGSYGSREDLVWGIFMMGHSGQF